MQTIVIKMILSTKQPYVCEGHILNLWHSAEKFLAVFGEHYHAEQHH